MCVFVCVCKSSMIVMPRTCALDICCNHASFNGKLMTGIRRISEKKNGRKPCERMCVSVNAVHSINYQQPSKLCSQRKMHKQLKIVQEMDLVVSETNRSQVFKCVASCEAQ